MSINNAEQIKTKCHHESASLSSLKACNARSMNQTGDAAISLRTPTSPLIFIIHNLQFQNLRDTMRDAKSKNDSLDAKTEEVLLTNDSNVAL